MTLLTLCAGWLVDLHALQAAKRPGWRETVSRGSARQAPDNIRWDVAVWAQPLINLKTFTAESSRHDTDAVLSSEPGASSGFTTSTCLESGAQPDTGRKNERS